MRPLFEGEMTLIFFHRSANLAELGPKKGATDVKETKGPLGSVRKIRTEPKGLLVSLTSVAPFLGPNSAKLAER